MRFYGFLAAACIVTIAFALPWEAGKSEVNEDDAQLSRDDRSRGGFIDWKTYRANGVNLGAWLEKEKGFDPIWWDSVAPNTTDEWTICLTKGFAFCGRVLEDRYASFLNTSTVDDLAKVGINTLRIPMTYAAWVRVPGSYLYTGAQVAHMRKIAYYAIDRYNMHVIIGLHSLPGGTNFLEIGEAFGRDFWFNNETNLQYSYRAIDGILNFIESSGRKPSFTIAPLNEASDTKTVGFGTSAALTANGAVWVNKYLQGVLQRVEKVDRRIPVMIQDSFQGAGFWSPKFRDDANIVFDTHVYYFAVPGAFANNITSLVCARAAALTAGSKFPVFVGEWSLQILNNNTFAGRRAVFDVQRSAFNKYASGSGFWNVISYATTLVDGQGTQREYWSYIDLINQGVINGPKSPLSY